MNVSTECSSSEVILSGGQVLSVSEIDAAFPGWRSIELFGASGTGKTHLCRNLADPAVWATLDSDRIRHRIDTGTHPITRLLLSLAGRRIAKKIGRWRERREIASLLAARDVREYLKLAELVISTAELAVGLHRNYQDAILLSAALLVLADREEKRVLVDEGIVRRIVAILAIRWERGISKKQILLIQACLTAYPWEKSAMLFEAPLPTRISRVEGRDSPKKVNRLAPHIQNHEAGEVVSSLANQCGWHIKTFRTG